MNADDQIRAAAERARAAGDHDAAAELERAEAPPITPPAGLDPFGEWQAKVTDLVALAEAVVAGEAPGDLLVPNTARLADLARTLGADCQIPGVQVFPVARRRTVPD